MVAFLANLLRRYTFGQRVVIVIVAIGMVSAIIALVLWAQRPEYGVLYSDMDPATAGKIVSELRGMKIKYKVLNGGKTISVPVEKVAELRLKFAEEGYIGGAVVGYEVFDNAKIGMTTFMQRLNMRRALEGELVKTINQFPGVKNSRVHLVFPEETLFGEKKTGTASVVLYLNPNTYLSSEQIRGITALVANSVEGIEPEGVVVVDSDGNLLTSEQSGGNLESVGNQWELRHAVETKIRDKVRDIVEGVVGFRNAVVEVAVDLDFQKVERTMESYDPENVVVVSEERHTESSQTVDSTRNVNEGFEKENVITNYDLNKTVERYVSNTGTIRKLSVAVLVDGTYKATRNDDGEEVKEYVPRSRQELDQIASLVKSAVGFDAERGDIVEVQNLRFDNSVYESEQEYFEKAEQRALWAGIVNKGFIVVGILFAFFLLRTLIKSSGTVLQVTLPATAGLKAGAGGSVQLPVPEEEEEIPEDIYISKLSPEARAKLRAKDKMTQEVVNYSKESPEDTARLIRSWLTTIDEQQ
jgi:flagellar M-ring protein FliF